MMHLQMQQVIRRAAWFAGVAWILSWFALYLEVYRYHHVMLSRVADALWPTRSAAPAARPGGFVRSVVLCSALAPLLFFALRLWSAHQRASQNSVQWIEPSFPIGVAIMAFGAALCALGGINQLVRQPPFAVDLTLRTGNGGFIALGVGLVIAGIVVHLAGTDTDAARVR